jgi:hypothetical protein
VVHTGNTTPNAIQSVTQQCASSKGCTGLAELTKLCKLVCKIQCKWGNETLVQSVEQESAVSQTLFVSQGMCNAGNLV